MPYKLIILSQYNIHVYYRNIENLIFQQQQAKDCNISICPTVIISCYKKTIDKEEEH